MMDRTKEETAEFIRAKMDEALGQFLSKPNTSDVRARIVAEVADKLRSVGPDWDLRAVFGRDLEIESVQDGDVIRIGIVALTDLGRRELDAWRALLAHGILIHVVKVEDLTLSSVVTLYPHCDELCGDGTAEFECPVCGWHNKDYDLWSDVQEPNFVRAETECVRRHCKAALVVEKVDGDLKVRKA